MQQNSAILRHPTQDSLDNPEGLALLYKAAGERLRLIILRILRSDSLGVLEMSSILDIRQSALSHHLKVLLTASLVSTRREGNTIFYRRVFLNTDDPLSDLKNSLYSSVDRLQLETDIAQRLAAVKKERELQSLDFFTKSADKFKANQDLVADASQYAASLKDLLQGIRPAGPATVMEIGPGEGNLLPLLAGNYSQVIALDNSEEMLSLARETAGKHQLQNVAFVAGDTSAAVAQALQADLIIFSMVLHHMASPMEAFCECASLLNSGGSLLVVDLCRHQQEWVRSTCGDVWLGFEPEELTNWARQAGFDNGQSLFQGLRNGFQIQMHLFHLKPNT